MHHLTPRAPPICRKDHPCIEGSASHFQLFPLTMGDRRWARAGRAVPPYLQPGSGCLRCKRRGCLCAFPAWWTRYLDSVCAASLTQIPLSLLFLELSGYGVNAVQRHVNAADVLVRRGVDMDGFR